MGKICEHLGKHPRTKHGVKAATTNPEKIKRWWKRNPDANVGIATGAESGIIVLDIDPRHDGDKMLELPLRLLGGLPETVVASTGGGGLHYVFAHPEGSVKNVQGILPGIDVKGDAGYILAAPSNHLSGRLYEWLPNLDPWSVKPAALPETWLEWLRSRGVIWTPGPTHHRLEPLANTLGEVPSVAQAVQAANSRTPLDDRSKTDGQRYREIQSSRERETEAIYGGCGGNSNQRFSAVSTLDELTIDEKRAVRRAIERNLPKGPGERNQKRLFAFTRAIAGIPRLRDAGDPVLRAIVQLYFEAAAPQTSGTHDFEDYWDEFRYGLDRVRFPGDFSMIEIIEAVAAQPPHAACVAKGYAEPRRVLLVGLCAELQRRHGENPFFLSCAKAAELLTGVGHPTAPMQIHRMLDGFRRNELLQLAQKGSRHAATRWRFLWKPPASPEM
jgi:hypothetical protein